MPYSVQVVVDCASPHVLADWWAEALGWEVEPQDADFIRRMVDEGHATADQTTTHRGALVWREGAAINAPDAAGSPRILFVQVPESKTGKNRVHLDIRTGADDPVPVRERLLARGATFVHDGRQGPHTWVTMTDPEGNEFCV